VSEPVMGINTEAMRRKTNCFMRLY
jgi:hypothetical protein